MKKQIMLSFAVIALYVSCHKKDVQKNCCKQTVVYEIVDSAVLFMPNCFTPNKDGKNDIFRMRGRNIASLSVTIYDREEYFIQFDKNKIILQTTDVNFQWDGIIQAGKHKGKTIDGDYPFTIDAVTTSGKNIHGSSTIAVIVDPSKYCLKHLTNCATEEQFQNGYYSASNPTGEHFGKCK